MSLRTLGGLVLLVFLGACQITGNDQGAALDVEDESPARQGILPSTVSAYEILDQKASQTYENPLVRADSFRKEYRFPEALQLLNHVLEAHPTNYDALWKKSSVISEMGFLIANASVKEDYFYEALYLAKKALGIRPDGIGAHFAMALALGRMEAVVDDHRKVTFAVKMKKHAETVLRMDSTYHYAWYLLGSWSYDFAGLSDSDYAVAKSMFGSDVVHNATYEHAIEFFQKALSFEPDNVVYNYHTAMAYMQVDREDEALDFLRKAVRQPLDAEKEEEFIRRFNRMLTGQSN